MLAFLLPLFLFSSGAASYAPLGNAGQAEKIKTASANIAAIDAPQETPDHQLFSRISLSFSQIPFDVQSKDVLINLAKATYVSCEVPWNCRFDDTNNVSHNFEGEEGRLAGKSLYAHYFDNKPIGALGIGMARQKSDVLKQISAFLNQADYVCKDVPTILATTELRYSGNTACIWRIGKGHVYASFDKMDQLSGTSFSSVTAGL